MSDKEIREKVIDTFKSYGGWWWLEGMADWVDESVGDVRKVYDKLEADGLMERRRNESTIL